MRKEEGRRVLMGDDAATATVSRRRAGGHFGTATVLIGPRDAQLPDTNEWGEMISWRKEGRKERRGEQGRGQQPAREVVTISGRVATSAAR